MRKRILRRRYHAHALTWEVFERSLASALYDLDIGEFLVLMTEGTQYFVQFADQGPYGMRVEAASNAYLGPEFQLQEPAIRRLITLGWNAPTYAQANMLAEPTDGSPNFFIDATCPVRTRDIARLAVRTLREVHGAASASDLMYRAYSTEFDSIRFSQLGIACIDAFGFGCAAILEEIAPEVPAQAQFPLATPVEVS
ncbi:MAG: TY-Chap domain-containing protein [Gemmatimonadaceae bacterium]